MTGGEKPAPAFVPQPLSWKEKLAVRLLYFLIRGLFLTLRVRFEDRSGQIKGGGGPLIFCTWHNRLILGVYGYKRYFRRHRADGAMAALISASRDGGMLAEIFTQFGLRPVRGSSSRRGRQALLEATTWVEQKNHITITPDGPRGPRYSIHEGVIALAQLTGAPVVPFSSHVRWKLELKSWDRFQIPLPFAKCVIHVGPPVFVPRNAGAEERERWRIELRRRMDAITRD
jgi:lysophospholipid acyltransferase (LPLAT)-like uncharacterized protein